METYAIDANLFQARLFFKYDGCNQQSNIHKSNGESSLTKQKVNFCHSIKRNRQNGDLHAHARVHVRAHVHDGE